MRIGIVGTGRIATTLVRGWTAGGMAGSEILVSPRGRRTAERLAREHGVRVAPDNAAVVRECEVVVLSVPPDDACATAAALDFRAGQRVISLCAGVPLADLRPLVAPASVAQAMPTSAATVGASVVPVFGGDPVVHEVLGRLGPVVPVESAAAFEAATVFAAMYGWGLALIARSAAFGRAAGLPPDAARRLAAESLVAAGRMIAAHPDAEPGALAAEVQTEGGITELGIRTLDRHGALEAWDEAHRRVLARLRGDGPDGES